MNAHLCIWTSKILASCQKTISGSRLWSVNVFVDIYRAPSLTQIWPDAVVWVKTRSGEPAVHVVLSFHREAWEDVRGLRNANVRFPLTFLRWEMSQQQTSVTFLDHSDKNTHICIHGQQTKGQGGLSWQEITVGQITSEQWSQSWFEVDQGQSQTQREQS